MVLSLQSSTKSSGPSSWRPARSEIEPAPLSIRLHEMIELRPFASDQKLGRSIIKTRALQLPDGGAQFENLGAQPQDPVSVRVVIHGAPSKISAPSARALGNTGCLHETKAHAVADVRQDIGTAGGLPFPDQQVDLSAQIHLRQGLFGAIAIAVDGSAHGRLDVGHLQPQGADFTSNFINSVVHGLLEQNKNI
ncbi:hypothetical protein GGE24_000208 [Bradyrhizobium centrosematis]|nr:hypothetical protein [Bradyrhizobium centrosematis]MCS3770896.1 hypothetical protein [Bradyrhizobium centrosematis]